MKYSLCLEMLYNNIDFIDRFKAASDDGFEYAEFWRWEGRNWEAVKNAVGDSGLKISAFSGDDKFSPVNADEKADYLDFLSSSIEKAVELKCPNLVIHSDALNPEDGSAKELGIDLSYETKLINLYDVLKEAALMAEKADVTLVLEPLNTLVDHKNYFLSDPDVAFDLIRSVSSPKIKLLYDIYHMQIMKGNVIDRITKNIDCIGYFHAADVPGRCEPGTGELNYRKIFSAVKDAGYKGFTGFELLPAGDNSEAVKAIKGSMV